MGILNTITTTAMCIVTAIMPFQLQQPSYDQTAEPQSRQVAGTGRKTDTFSVADTVNTPHINPPTPSATSAASDNADNEIGPQGTCAPISPQTWGTPASNATVNNVPGRDASPIQWEIDSQCTLIVHHGTSPDYITPPWAAYRSTINKIRIDGNVTLYVSSVYVGTGAFSKMPALSTVQVNGTLHLAEKAGEGLFSEDATLAGFPGAVPNGFETSRATSMNIMFQRCGALTSLDLRTFDTSNVTDMGSMFSDCVGLTSLILPSTFKTNKVTSMIYMFSDCEQLRSLDLSVFDTSNVTGMTGMFLECSRMTSLNLPSTFRTDKVTSMYGMFANCASLKSLDLRTFDTANVTNMEAMFFGCRELTALPLPSTFTTSKVVDMQYMFASCSKLQSLDLSMIDTRTAIASTGSLATIKVMLADNASLRELWLGPHTNLAKTDTDSQAFRDPDDPSGQTDLPYNVWVEVPATGPRIPVPDMRARTSVSSGRNPQGHYIIPTAILTIDYNNGQSDHTDTFTTRATTPGSKQIAWGSRPAPAGKVFDGWELTSGDPSQVTINGNTVSWNATSDNNNLATVTAKWRTVGQPALSVNVHADGATNQWGNADPWAEITATMPANSRTGDTITFKSFNGTGATSTCTPAAGVSTCTFNLTIGQLRDPANFDALYHLAASISAVDRRDTDTTVTGEPTDKQGTLPYTTINYRVGTGATGMPPDSAKALTDTNSRKAQLTVAGPNPIVHPDYSLFTTWQANHGTAAPGTSPVPVSLGDTDSNGNSTITFTAGWVLVDAPELEATKTSNGTVKVTGSAKPYHPTDFITICHPTTSGAPQCQNVTPSSTDANGNTLPYDGTTKHPWSITLPADTPAGSRTIDAFLNSPDPAYPAPGQVVQSALGSTPVPVLQYQQSLPLTGGRARLAVLLLAATLVVATLTLDAAANLRNRRIKARHSNNN